MNSVFWSQNFNLNQAGSCIFNKSIYCFGLSHNKGLDTLVIYQLNQQLNKLDSLELLVDKIDSHQYLNLSYDTLHDYLNIHLQESGVKHLSIIRLSKKFKLIYYIKHVEVARLNNSDLFGKNKVYLKDDVFAIKSSKDSSGEEFYLNKYKLKSENENFEYNQIWQYPFERKNINHIQILMVDTHVVCLKVSIYKGNKAGDWFLKINSKTGQLIKALKINDKNDISYLMPGSILYNKNEKYLHLIGQKISSNQYNPLSQKMSAVTSTVALIYFITIDSLDHMTYKKDFKIPLIDLQQGNKKTNNSYYIKFNRASLNASGKIIVETDLFKNENASNCFLYSNTSVLNFWYDGENFQVEKLNIGTNLEIENYYRSNDKLNMNGKICVDSASQLNQIYSNDLVMPVKINYRTDENMNGYWLLKKSDFKNQMINVSTLGPVNKIYQIKSLINIHKANFCILPYSNNKIIIGNQMDENNYQLSIYQW